MNARINCKVLYPIFHRSRPFLTSVLRWSSKSAMYCSVNWTFQISIIFVLFAYLHKNTGLQNSEVENNISSCRNRPSFTGTQTRTTTKNNENTTIHTGSYNFEQLTLPSITSHQQCLTSERLRERTELSNIHKQTKYMYMYVTRSQLQQCNKYR